MLDKATEDKSRLAYARVCVEVDLTSQYPKTISVLVNDGLMRTIDVEYAWIPVKCKVCSGFGHSTAQCPKSKHANKPVQKVWKAVGTQQPDPHDAAWTLVHGKHAHKPRSRDIESRDHAAVNVDSSVPPSSRTGPDMSTKRTGLQGRVVEGSRFAVLDQDAHNDIAITPCSNSPIYVATAETELVLLGDTVPAGDTVHAGDTGHAGDTVHAEPTVAPLPPARAGLETEHSSLQTISQLRDKRRNMGVEQLPQLRSS